MEKQENASLNESVFTDYEVFETDQGATVFQIPLSAQLDEEQADEFANRVANFLFDEGYDDFDIEFSTDDEVDEDEITLDGDEFFEEFGVMWYNDDDEIDEAEYQGRKVKLGKPMRGDVKKFKVYVRDPKTKNIKKVNFGDPNMKIKKSSPARRRSFRARHNCDNPGPRTKARYWSCRKW